MKIIHLVASGNSVLIDSFIKYLRKTDNPSNHTICCLQNQTQDNDFVYQQTDLDGLTRIIYPIRLLSFADSIQLARFLRTFNKIILHSQFLSVKTQFVLMLYPWIMKKLYWVSWGWDLYQWDADCTNNLRGRIKRFVNYSFRKKVAAFVGVFPPDVEYYKQEFSSGAKGLFAPYGIIPTFHKDVIKIRDEHTTNIQIGHSATRILMHKEILDMLYRFQDENIHIFIPMVYGDMDYADEIEKYALGIFGNKATVMRSALPPDDYTQYLATIDIAIFSANRQIALGNIYQLLDMNKKVYLSFDSVMSNFFKALDVPIGDIESICSTSLIDFKKTVASRTDKYIDFRELCTEHYGELWNNVFYG